MTDSERLKKEIIVKYTRQYTKYGSILFGALIIITLLLITNLSDVNRYLMTSRYEPPVEPSFIIIFSFSCFILLSVILYSLFADNVRRELIKPFEREQDRDLYLYPCIGSIYDIANLFAAVIISDAEIAKKEVEIAHEYFQKRFQKSTTIFFKSHYQILCEELDKKLQSKIRSSIDCALLIVKSDIPYEARLELLEYLFKTAYADEGIKELEMKKLDTIARYMRIAEWDLISLKYQYEYYRRQTTSEWVYIFKTERINQAYSTLGLTNSATDQEIKKAYREIVKLNHPDRLLPSLTDEERELAVQHFRQATEAYDIICKERGI